MVGQSRAEEQIAGGKNCQSAAKTPYNADTPTPGNNSSAEPYETEPAGGSDQFKDPVHPATYASKAPSAYPNMRKGKLIERDYPVHLARRGELFGYAEPCSGHVDLLTGERTCQLPRPLVPPSRRGRGQHQAQDQASYALSHATHAHDSNQRNHNEKWGEGEHVRLREQSGAQQRSK